MFTPRAICPLHQLLTHIIDTQLLLFGLLRYLAAQSISIIRQLHRGQKKRGKRHIITCFLSTAELDPDRTCEKKKVSVAVVLVTHSLLSFPPLKITRRNLKSEEAPPPLHRRESTVGTRRITASSSSDGEEGGEKMNGRVFIIYNGE